VALISGVEDLDGVRGEVGGGEECDFLGFPGLEIDRVEIRAIRFQGTDVQGNRGDGSSS
jgi:hypothetical protein